MGLFTGMSVLSIFELFMWACAGVRGLVGFLCRLMTGRPGAHKQQNKA